MPSVRQKSLTQDAIYWSPLVRNQFPGGGTVAPGYPILVKSRWHSKFTMRETMNHADVTVGFDPENAGFIMLGGWSSLDTLLLASAIDTIAKYSFEGVLSNDDDPGGDLDLAVSSGSVSFSAGVTGNAVFAQSDVAVLLTSGNATWVRPDRFGFSTYLRIDSVDTGVEIELSIGGVSCTFGDQSIDIGGTTFTMSTGWASSFVPVFVQFINGETPRLWVSGALQTPTTSVATSAAATSSPIQLSFDKNGTSDVIGVDDLYISSEFVIDTDPNKYNDLQEVLDVEMANAVRGSWDGRVRHIKLKR